MGKIPIATAKEKVAVLRKKELTVASRLKSQPH
jgi:hypothetical protein